MRPECGGLDRKLRNLPLFSPSNAASGGVVARRCLLHDMYRPIRCPTLGRPDVPRLPFSVRRCQCETTPRQSETNKKPKNTTVKSIFSDTHKTHYGEFAYLFTLLTKAAPLEAFAIRMRANRAFCCGEGRPNTKWDI